MPSEVESPRSAAWGLILVMACASGTGRCGPGGPLPAKPPDVAVVGKTGVSGKDIRYRVLVEMAYGNRGLTDADGLASLLVDGLESEVGRIHRVVPTRAEVDSLKRRVDKSTKAPQLLRAVKGIFGRDVSSYERLFLLPKAVSPKLRAWYSRDPDIHRRERSLIEKAHALARSGSSFEDIAKKLGLSWSAADALGTAAVQDGREGGPPPAAQPQLSQLEQILGALAVGEVYRNIVEDDDGYRVMRIKERSAKGTVVESVSVSKAPFDSWFREEALSVPIRILDRELKTQILEKYGNAWWVRLIR